MQQFVQRLQCLDTAEALGLQIKARIHGAFRGLRVEERFGDFGGYVSWLVAATGV